ncbi:hypothetical protein OHA40_25560 [Nocardia sp. NBC_00508]|uniref:hypothetical protein n=1 Tax=Nocardia sp. NBC_00508 TaxID=2975992 RepID=UPI002E802A18|nr:hypothetical protein [Nocardia sp. NBC_00508]WUD65004.1 hypothetical protein OHA40_25560 [Nocardia sp. NBC_00508]
MKPISTVTTLLIPLLFALGVVSAPPVAAHPHIPEPALGACAGSVCLPSLPGLLRRAPFRQSEAGGEDPDPGPNAASSGVPSCDQAESVRVAVSAVVPTRSR